jgi:hypothetical protein
MRKRGIRVRCGRKPMRGMTWVGLAVLAGAVAFARPAGGDDEGYDLRGPAPKKGQVYLSKGTITIKKGDLTLTVGGDTTRAKQTMVLTGEEEETVLAVDGRQVTRCRTRVIKDRIATVTELGGQELEDDEPGELESEVVVSERLGEAKWRHTLVDSKPTDRQRKKLDKREGPESDDPLYPEGKVKVGHAWSSGAEALRRSLGKGLSELEGKVDQKFARVEQVAGESCAVIEMKGKLKGKLKDEDGDLELSMDFKSTSWRSLKTAVDVKERYEGTITISGKQKSGGMAIGIHLEGPFVAEGTTSVK